MSTYCTHFNYSCRVSQEYIETIFTVFTLEILSKVAVFGWKAYIERMRNVFDFTITPMAIISSGIVHFSNVCNDSRLIRMIVTARVLRLLRLLTALKPFQLIVSISAMILPAATRLTLVLFLVMYLFAALGMQLYGGMITRDPQNPLALRILDTAFSDSEYWANNFNDMISGMIVSRRPFIAPFASAASDCLIIYHDRLFLTFWSSTTGSFVRLALKLRHKRSGSVSTFWPFTFWE